MRRLLAVVLLAALGLTACHGTGKHWAAGKGAVIYIRSTPARVTDGGSGSRIHYAIDRAADVWNSRLDNLTFRVVSACDGRTPCVTVERQERNGAVTILGGAGDHLYGATMIFDDEVWPSTAADNCAVHELGALGGLGLSTDPRSVMANPCDDLGFPSDGDVAEVDATHDHRHG